MPVRGVRDAAPYNQFVGLLHIFHGKLGKVPAWSGDHALQKGRAFRKFYRLPYSKSQRADGEHRPLQSFAAFAVNNKVSPRRDEGIAAYRTVYHWRQTAKQSAGRGLSPA